MDRRFEGARHSFMILHDRYGNPMPVYCKDKCKKHPDCRLKYRVAAKYCENSEEVYILDIRLVELSIKISMEVDDPNEL